MVHYRLYKEKKATKSHLSKPTKTSAVYTTEAAHLTATDEGISTANKRRFGVEIPHGVLKAERTALHKGRGNSPMNVMKNNTHEGHLVFARESRVAKLVLLNGA